MITEELKPLIVAELANRRENFGGSDAKYAISLGINTAQYSRIKNGDYDKVLSDSNWITLARRLGISLGNLPLWKTAETPTYTFIYTQLKKCQELAVSLLICDVTDIGKTHTAKEYVKQNKNAVYVDCSQVKSRQKLVRYIAKEFGVGDTGKYNDVYEDLVFYLGSIANPIIILDEAGDLQYDAFLELKALWNATEHVCSWVMMGADGLKEKIKRSINCKKVGYAEIFRRYGKRYQRATPDGKEALDEFNTLQAALIIQANSPGAKNIQQLIKRTEGSLERIRIELTKGI